MGFSAKGFLDPLALLLTLTAGTFLLEEGDDLVISLNGGEGGATGSSTGDSGLGMTTGGIGTTLGIGAQVRGAVAGLVSGVVAVVVLEEAIGAVFTAIAGRLFG